MRVLFLTKQRYMGKDLLRDRFGRFYEFPKALAEAGHQVRAVCLKYWRDQQPTQLPLEDCEVAWSSHDLGWNLPAGFVAHYCRLKKLSQGFHPDVIVGASDSMHVILAATLSASLAVPFAIDLYDNFESYRATRAPGIKQGLVWAIKKAAAVSAISDPLREKVAAEYGPRGLLTTISNAICADIFHPYEKARARVEFGLPSDAILIGTAGALTRERGIETLYSAFERLSESLKNPYLVLAGPHDGSLPSRDNIIYLGELPHAIIGKLFGALDIGVICNRESEFGKYCFPQKLYEMLACRLPVVAADLGVTGQMFRDARQCLFDPQAPDTLVNAVTAQLGARYIPPIPVPSWAEQGRLLEDMLARVVTAVAPMKGDDQLTLSQQPSNPAAMNRRIL